MKRQVLLPGLLAAALVAGCVDESGGVRLSSFDIDGVRSVSETDLRRTLATRAGGRWPWSRAVTFDEQALREDLDRIRLFYTDRGFPDARVDSIAVDFNDARTEVAVRIAIDEGTPLIVEDVRLEGFDELDEATRPVVPTNLEPGERFDRAAFAALRQSSLEAFQNNGYPYGTVETAEQSAGPGRITLIVRGASGPKAVFGDVSIEGLSALDERVVRRQLGLRPGTTFNQSRVVQAQRRLSTLEVLQFVNVDARPPAVQVTEVPIRVTVAEDKLRRLQIGVGYGTEERVRGSIEWTHLNFLGDARRASAKAEWSKIQRRIEVGFAEPYFLRRGLSLEALGSTRWSGERIYTAASYGGRVAIVYRGLRGTRTRGVTRPPGDRLSGSYIYEFLRYDVRPEVRVDLTRPDELLALGIDPVTGKGRGTRAALALDYERTDVNNAADPRSGYSLLAHAETAGPMLGGTYDYREARVEAKGYLPLGPAVVAARVAAGRIAAPSDADVPFPQRYFLGGASSLRGWGRYQVASLAEGVPVGGLTRTDASLELRLPVREGIGLVGFVDAGRVGGGKASTATPLLSDAGVGIRYQTPIGLVRGDIAVQLKRFEGLNEERTSDARSWRLHIGIGHAF